MFSARSTAGLLTRPLAVLWIIAMMSACGEGRPGHVLDEAMRAGRDAGNLKPAIEDYFKDMDDAMPLTFDEIKGRNMWNVWTGGNDRFWDAISVTSYGTLDFLKTVSSHPILPHKRGNRWVELGLVNEPCYTEATGPDPNRFGLWLDVRDPKCPPDPFADEKTYPGVEIGSRGTTMPVGSLYGEPSGIVGLRLFPNPDFDEEARRKWDAERYYRDESYYFSRDLVKPYRVGMSCAFCHVGPNPVKPPPNPEQPEWAHLSSNVGAQYFWVDRIFNWKGDANRGSFFYQLFHTSRPGTLDTSLVSTDNINNPRTMNAVYGLPARMALAKRWGKEQLAGGQLDNKQFNQYVPPNDPLGVFFQAPDTVWTPRVLKDGSDSVGALGALNRVYINIGVFSEEWLLHFRPLVGGQPITPIEIKVAQKNSAYWRATEAQTINMARFFLKASGAHKLADAPGGNTYLSEDAATVDRGKVVFAEYCARCHSSKGPALPKELDLESCNGPGYLDCWNRYWARTQTAEFKKEMRTEVMKPDFLEDNYLSNELRVPATLLQTNMCSAVATNAIAGNIWDNFSSASYKSLPPVGTVKVRHPITGEELDFVLPGGGRGYIRPASLISLWSTSPFLQNNTIGRFNPSPSVDARMKSFTEAIEQLLWPERRRKDDIFKNITGPGVGAINRTTAPSSIWLPVGYVPSVLRPLLGLGQRFFPFFFNEGNLEIGPIPQNFPIDLIANADLLGTEARTFGQRHDQRKLLLRLFRRIKEQSRAGKDILSDPETIKDLLSVSQCPDFVVNKGHYFGTDLQPGEAPLSDADKRALIAFLKRF
jgi:hypothetical protein